MQAEMIKRVLHKSEMKALLSVHSFVMLLLVSGTIGAFPPNSKPISTISREDVKSSIFTGGDTDRDRLSYVQDIKRMKMAGKDVLAITSRNNLYILDPDAISPSKGGKISYDAVFTWTPDIGRKSLCVRKGQTEENCGNYLRVLESMDEDGNKLIVCATNSYSPRCQYITATTQRTGLRLTASNETFPGTEMCAFGPDQTGVSIYTGGALYSGTMSEFSGRSYTITRSLGEAKQLRTPKYDPKSISEPVFVKMIDDGDRVLIFMNERVLDEKTGLKRMVPHVAQVCKNDHGGQHVLTRQWTKYVKARLNCSTDGFYFDQLQDISDPVEVVVDATSGSSETMLFATFTTPDNAVPGSAICSFSIDAIHTALKSRFQEDQSDRKSKDASPPTGKRHPGFCPDERFTESELQYLKTHPLLEDQVRGLLLNTYAAERWTSIAVDTSAGPLDNWTVYFVGTSNGTLLRYLAPPSGAKAGILLGRQEVFNPSICNANSTNAANRHVTNVLVDPKRDNIIVTFKHCVIAIPLRPCSVHKCKESCVASGDPYCGWNGTKCINYPPHQDVNVEQYVLKTALNPQSNVDNLCPATAPFPETKEETEVGAVDTTTSKEGESKPDNDSEDEQKVPVNGTTSGPDHGLGKKDNEPETLPQESMLFEKKYFTLIIVVSVLIAMFFFVLGFCISKYCCRQPCIEKEAEDGLERSKASIAVKTNIIQKAVNSIMASLSPKRRRKPATPSASHSITTLSQPTETPLLPKSNKQDEALDVPDGGSNLSANTLPQLPTYNNRSRINSLASGSQVTMGGSVVSYNTNRRASHMTASASSMGTKPQPPAYATAPRPRHASGNRSSDPGTTSRLMSVPSEFAPPRGANGRSRHSTPVPPIPASPCKSDVVFSFRDEAELVVNSTEHTLRGVEEVIASQQRRSQEMSPLAEDPDESRPRHDSTDSGKGSSPRNSMQTEEEQNRVPTLPRPGNLELGQRGRRRRLNSEPMSPGGDEPYYQTALPPSSAHKPIARSISMRTQQQPAYVAIPNGYPKKRSGSFSANSQPSTPSGQNSPPRSAVGRQNYPHHTPQQLPQQQMIYATLPTNPNAGGGRRGHADKMSRQQSYDTYSPHNQTRYLDQNGHQVIPDKYNSLPLRSQAHRSKKNPITPQYPGQPQHGNRHSGGMPQGHPAYQQQWSAPAPIYEHHRPASAQRLRYVPTPTVPTTKPMQATLSETNAV